MNVHGLPAASARLRHLAGRLGLGEKAYARAKEIAGLAPDAGEWRRLIDRFFLILGAGLILTGIAAFFAYNWAGLHKFAKFGVVQAAIVACVCGAWIRGFDNGVGRSALFAAAFLVGVLFAVYGQTYQTGADPYGLFLVWAVLILGWTLIGRQAGLWMLTLILLNLSLVLYWTQVLRPQGFNLVGILGPVAALSATFSDASLAALVFALNASALVLWEVVARRNVSWMHGRTFSRVVSLMALAPVVASSFILIFASGFERVDGWNVLALLLFVGFVSASLFFFRVKTHDLFILTVCLLGAILLVTSVVARIGGTDTELWFVLAALVVGQTAAAALWLRNVAQGWEEAG